MTLARTLWTWLSSRVIEPGKLRFSLLRKMVRLTLVLGSPRIRLTAWSMLSPLTAVSSIRVIRSPLLRPARKAGEPSIGETTLTRPSSMPISMHTPTNLPVVPSRNSLKLFLSKYWLCGSSPATMPPMASVISFFSSTGSTYSALTMPNTAASCCISSRGRGPTLLRAMAWSWMVVNAPATAPRVSSPATFILAPMSSSAFSARKWCHCRTRHWTKVSGRCRNWSVCCGLFRERVLTPRSPGSNQVRSGPYTRPMDPISVVIVEDDERFRAAFATSVAETPDMRLAGTAGDLAPGLRLLREQRPDVLLVDLGLPNGSGVELIRYANDHLPNTDVMVVSVFGDEPHVMASLEAGATGYLLKDAQAADVTEQIRSLRAGGSPISPVIARQLLLRLTPQAAPVVDEALLSPQERQVLTLAARGFNFEEIARMLEVSRHTVMTYVKRSYRKLQVHSKTEAIYEARKLGLVRDGSGRP